VNRLADESSLYLRQHADNPVDWYPWGAEALDRAAAEDRPLLISVGYSSCHWCHVMAHESFENPAIASVMNDLFVCVKVDREERPDIDALYMQATLLLARQGGWPMTVFATPDGRPYFAGTYFPPASRGSMPGFADLCTWMAEVYRERGAEVDAQANELVGQIARIADRAGSGATLSSATIDAALAGMVTTFDTAQGGFGGAPKFPPSNVLEFLVSAPSAAPAREMALITLRRMADGGIRDHLAGGFHRYSVDDRWLVPHFEKMLYDNALLARAYVGAARVDEDPRWRQVAEQTLDYLIAEMELPDGGFAASQDADSPGGEGAYFVWTPSEIADLMPAAEAEAVMLRFGVTNGGNFGGRNILHAALPLPMVAEAIGTDPEPLIATGIAAMRSQRANRPAPARDDKLIAAWNGLAIAALADAGAVFGRADYTAAARRAAERILAALVVDGRLHRTLQGGSPRHLGQLEDYADLCHGLLQLYAATFDTRWLTATRTLADDMIARFSDPAGGFFATGSDAPAVLVRMRDLDDQPAPSGNSQAASVLVRLAGLTGRTELLELASAAVAGVVADIPRVPLSFGTALGVIDAVTGPRREIAIVGPAGDPRTDALIAAARAAAGPGDVVACGDPADAGTVAAVPLLAGRGMIDAAPTAYVCQQFACQAPARTPEELRAQLGG
jgi:uncharacterized protein YyaL (SSP411 family)